MHDADRDLPEGVINADPAGGWQDGDTADLETAERSEALASDGWVADIPQAENAAGTRRAQRADQTAGTDVGSVETDAASQGADPDLATDEAAERRTEEE